MVFLSIFVCHIISHVTFVETDQDLHLGFFEGADLIFRGFETVIVG